MPEASTRRGTVLGLAAAVTFGVSAPIATRLGEDLDAGLLAALLYLGATLALAPTLAARREAGRAGGFRQVDLPRLAALVLVGGVVAPVLLMVGLQRTGGLAGSLLLNLEGPFTVLIAVVVLHEHLGRRSLLAGALVIGAAAALGAAPGSLRVDGYGVALIAGACLAWAVDNNLTARLVISDPRLIVTVKVAAAGGTNLVVAIARGVDFPAAEVVGAALSLGAVSYGLSVLLDAYALRAIGAAREAVLFATAPFAGVVAAVVLGDDLSAVTSLAMVVMAVGAGLLVTDRHRHRHHHAGTVHVHAHRHDDGHHDHHEVEVPGHRWHHHEHEHRPLVHAHAHASDLHHRHPHDGGGGPARR